MSTESPRPPARAFAHSGGQQRWMRDAALLLLVLMGTILLLGNAGVGGADTNRATYLRGGVAAELSLFPTDKLGGAQHLVMVAGHAVVDFRSGYATQATALRKDAAWVLEDYQRNRGVPGALLWHIQRGVEETAADPKALLVFSGGQTRPAAAPASEALSYWLAAEAHGWWGHPEVRNRALLEEYARDSFENLLFAVARFREASGSFPHRFTVVSYAFKRSRFASQHAAALRIPEAAFNFVSEPPSALARFDLEAARAGEQRSAAGPFSVDPYGCDSTTLRDKRAARNPFARHDAYAQSAPEISALLSWCGPRIFPGELPWALEAAGA
mmetsp:Transcript_40594/g.126994  ORF Transcript_40594/g.126994 Transcript_40594/m.126994 type:complete len:328 (-) Transcript_40594:865-1848(-)|eukprot:CAMPEP_0118852222 /NCGR_PEP_ID=MMETSP1163-20130328/1327_1 /TAXON_ID=124430 /ORGANISM="Phaeomonas parva, Strain CCMP2877" /LENGTH=327 /DNA_ID=CAMNT_0006784631 /DNA_START=93 /DNA_END=1076 /DNA_ORIENTATION=-